MPWIDASTEQAETPPSRSAREARERIRGLESRCRLGLWGLAGFLVLSLAAYAADGWLPPLAPRWRALLGPAPPVRLISIALAVYAFAALLYILARMMEGGTRYRGWSHLGYTAGFYLFFGYAGALEENFWAVFAAGVTIFALEYFRLWSHCAEEVRRQRRDLEVLARREQRGGGNGAGGD